MLAPLLVIDVQNGFVNENSRHVISGIVKFSAERMGQGGAVVATRFINTAGSQWEKLIQWSRVRDEPEIDLVPELLDLRRKNPEMIISDKNTYSSLTPRVTRLLEDSGSNEVLLCGIATESCVLKTAVDLFEIGFRPVVLTDLCATHASREAEAAGLLVLSRFIGRNQLISSSDYLS